MSCNVFCCLFWLRHDAKHIRASHLGILLYRCALQARRADQASVHTRIYRVPISLNNCPLRCSSKGARERARRTGRSILSIAQERSMYTLYIFIYIYVCYMHVYVCMCSSR